jgi:serine/threonine-protein phosphatase 2A regulatory subunit A
MKRLPVVAYAMGPAATISDLVPFLQMLSGQGLEDELLLLLAKQMQTFVPNLLTTHEQMLSLFPILERLAAVEETVVREHSVVCFNHICEHFKGPLQSTTTSTLVSMTKRLVGADWFSAKVSVSGMLPALHKLTKNTEIPYLYKELCLDETPMVRRAASLHLGNLLASLEDPGSELIHILQSLCKDEQDSVRMLAVSSLATVGPSYGTTPDFTHATFLPILKAGSTDMSWYVHLSLGMMLLVGGGCCLLLLIVFSLFLFRRVRNHLAKNFSTAAKNLGFQSNPTKYGSDMALVMSCFVSLLADTEAEVRAAAVAHFAEMVHWGGSALFQSHMLPIIPSLADDPVMEVRSKCALAIMESSEGGTLEDPLIVNSFGPLLESFLQDEFQEVQLQVLGNLHKLSHLLNGMNGVVSAILNMSKAGNWRVRQGVAKLLPYLAEARGLDFFLTVLLEPAWLVLLLDPVSAVRSACVQGMETLVKVAGAEWVAQQILPQHVRIYNHAATGSYLVRITILQAHGYTALACTEGMTLWNDVVLQLLRGITDKVPNVRMVAANYLAMVVVAVEDPSQRALVEAQIVPSLEQQLAEETDLDARAAITGALAAVPKK